MSRKYCALSMNTVQLITLVLLHEPSQLSVARSTLPKTWFNTNRYWEFDEDTPLSHTSAWGVADGLSSNYLGVIQINIWFYSPRRIIRHVLRRLRLFCVFMVHVARGTIRFAQWQIGCRDTSTGISQHTGRLTSCGVRCQRFHLWSNTTDWRHQKSEHQNERIFALLCPSMNRFAKAGRQYLHSTTM